MPDRKPVAVPSVENTEQPGHVEFHIRGRFFEIDELEAGAYEEHIRTAAAAGEEDKTDMLLLEKLLVIDAVKVDGKKLDPEQWAKEKYPIYSRVVNEVKRLHWLDIETDEEKEAREKEAKKRAADDAKKPKSDVPNS